MNSDWWAKVPMAAIADDRLSPTDLKVLIALSGHANPGGECHAKRSSLAELIGISKPRVSVSTSRLEGFGWLSKTGNGANGMPCDYRIKVPGRVTDSVTLPVTDSVTLPVTDSVTLPVTDSVTLLQQTHTTDPYNRTPPVVPPLGGIGDQRAEVVTDPIEEPAPTPETSPAEAARIGPPLPPEPHPLPLPPEPHPLPLPLPPESPPVEPPAPVELPEPPPAPAPLEQAVSSATGRQGRRRVKIPCPEDYAPGERTIALLENAGIPEGFWKDQIGEFVLYWTSDRAGEKRPGWDATFLNRCKQQWARYGWGWRNRNGRVQGENSATGSGKFGGAPKGRAEQRAEQVNRAFYARMGLEYPGEDAIRGFAERVDDLDQQGYDRDFWDSVVSG